MINLNILVITRVQNIIIFVNALLIIIITTALVIFRTDKAVEGHLRPCGGACRTQR